MNPEMFSLRGEVIDAQGRDVRPRVHGNGFIQLDLSPTRRVNIWGDPRIPRLITPSTIHNHTFSFNSTIYKGQFVHRQICIVPATRGAYGIYEAETRRGEDTRLAAVVGRWNATIERECVFRAGERYFFEKNWFHETLAPWPCVTVIEKETATLNSRHNPKVLVPFGHEPDNTFDRYQTPPELLWQIIFEALR